MDKLKRKTFYKHCIVRACGNNSTKTPGKIYIRVPLDQELRHKWINAVGRKTTEFSSTNAGIYVCEDHFDLESDMENYLEWKLIGETEIMKKTAVPRLIHSRTEEKQNKYNGKEPSGLFGLHEEINIKNEPQEVNHQENKDQKNRHAKRPTVCPLCSKRISSNLPRHLERNHKDHKEVRLLKKMNPNSQERAHLLTAMRKRGYFRLKLESNLLIPVRASSKPDTKYFACPHCLGHYSKRFLHRHVKHCDRGPNADATSSRYCLSTSQTFMAEANAKKEIPVSSRLKKEVFRIMRPDNISFAAKNDPLIRLYGDKLFTKPQKKATVTAVSNRMREMSRLVIALRKTRELDGLVDALKPEMYDQLMAAAKTISGYDPAAKAFKSPSLAMHMGYNLRVLCDVAAEGADAYQRNEIQQLKTLIQHRWSGELSSLVQREKPCGAPQGSLATADVKLLDEYVDRIALAAFQEVNSDAPIALGGFKRLTECVLAKTAIFNREAVDQIQCLTVDAYNKEEREVSSKTLTGVEEVLAARLKTVVCGDQKDGYVLIPDRTRVYIDRLLRLRELTNVVSRFNPYLFAAPGAGSRWMAAAGVLGKLARGSEAKNWKGLVSAGFRSQVATTVQLMATREEEAELLAASVGRRPPKNIHQIAELARLLLEKQEVVESGEKYLDKATLEHDVPNSKAGFEDLEELAILESFSNKVESSSREDADDSSNRLKDGIREQDRCEPIRRKMQVTHEILERTKRSRIAWSDEEKTMVRKHFSKHIRKKISPKKLECEKFLKAHPQLFLGRGWVQLKAFVYNTYRMMA